MDHKDWDKIFTTLAKRFESIETRIDTLEDWKVLVAARLKLLNNAALLDSSRQCTIEDGGKRDKAHKITFQDGTEYPISNELYEAFERNGLYQPVRKKEK